MPTQIASPIPIAPGRRALHLVMPQDLFASLNATLSDKSNQLVTPSRAIQENDYTVPAPPPPSPVSFRPDHWSTASRR
ncbi:hypothetical protein QBC33DRAFT_555533 [Phialemonium atrogriseum]|uniref:Uncharacterized protein n=1 Tax=Phialemonium atrogriseum TaxID=1093897 RepID=A0AAJ0C982_9PEZI|nr:uncharacterized protein QBC33DRAFT_555533 [Phialemonium atrogriseum]KAK1771037.1 hypothetical protein QBC33DRAFT_555533 [Phialemonium atrogriseum]